MLYLQFQRSHSENFRLNTYCLEKFVNHWVLVREKHMVNKTVVHQVKEEKH
jgi:hypothetical protein